MSVTKDGSQVTLENGRVSVRVDITPEGIEETYCAGAGKDAMPVLRGSGSTEFGATFLAAMPDDGSRERACADYQAFAEDVMAKRRTLEDWPPEPAPQPELAPVRITYRRHEVRDLDGGGKELWLEGATESGLKVERTVTVPAGADYVRLETVLHAEGPLLLEHFENRFVFALEGDPDFTWTQLAKMIPENLIPDFGQKAPALIVQKGSVAAAIATDVDVVRSDDTWRQCQHCLDLDARPQPSARVSFGLCPTIPHAHSLFKHVPGQCGVVGPGPIRFACYLLLHRDAPSRQAHRRVVEFLWERFGHKALLEGHAAQKETFQAWQPKTWQENVDKIWYDTTVDGQPCGYMTCGVFFPKDAWFCAWWNNMRTAYALALYARRENDPKARERAGKVLNLVLAMPRKGGALPALYTESEEGGPRWHRDHPFGGIDPCYHAFDMAWTGYWLLRWLRDIDREDKRILPVCVELGDFLRRHQRDSGFIPSYYNEDLTVADNTRLNVESAEPAGMAVFLTELYRATRDKAYLDAAIKAMDYVDREIVPARKWFDYETFLSCSTKPYDFYDPITRQQPQNNMATIQAAMAFLALHEATGDPHHLERGCNVLDHLSLTQQVWTHPRMSLDLIGGFTTQNTDAEWSDARQAYCATIYLDYFERTGRLEYLERGIAALRSGLVVAPYENWSHTGFYDGPGAFSGFHWGQGSALASVEMVWDRYGDVSADLRDGWAYGINGCTVDAMTRSGDEIRLDIRTALEWNRPARIVFRNVPDGRFALTVNGHSAGRFTADELAKGVTAPIAKT